MTSNLTSVLVQKVLEAITEELKTNNIVQESLTKELFVPVMKSVMAEFTPYFIAAIVIVLSIFIASLITLIITLFSLFNVR